MCRKELLVVGAAIVIAIAAMMFFPVTGTADSLGPPTPPILNEVVNKLDNIQPAWSQKLPGAMRFVLVLDDEAVLDKETGLVWERIVSQPYMSWYDAVAYCTILTKGGRSGWHLATIEQLTSLLDKSVSSTPGVPKLPEGHPFSIQIGGGFWSATSDAENVNAVWFVGFGSGNIVPNSAKTSLRQAWCVRGGQSYDGK